MTTLSFRIPERRTSSTGETFFECKLSSPGYELPHDLEWSKDTGLKPVLSIQRQISDLRLEVLKYMVNNNNLFKNPPTLSSLQAITPNWGLLLRSNNTMEWSQINKWIYESDQLKKQNAIVRMVLMGLEISRSTIIPVWTLTIKHVLPEKSENVIDFDFSTSLAEINDTKSVASVNSDDIGILEEDEIFQLHSPSEKKRQMKTHVRELLQKVAEARHAADDAMDRFLEEFELSDNESDFSDEEDD